MLYNETEKHGQIFVVVIIITLKGVITSREFRVPGQSCEVGKFDSNSLFQRSVIFKQQGKNLVC